MPDNKGTPKYYPCGRINNKGTPKYYYCGHIVNARNAGIDFQLTFKQWWAIWCFSGHWHERGRHRGQYVMARTGDIGPYAVGNVKIILHEINSAEGAAHRGPFTPIQRAKLIKRNKSLKSRKALSISAKKRWRRWRKEKRESGLTAILVTTIFLAESLPLPAPHIGSCAYGYFSSNGYCVPRDDASDAVPSIKGSCPKGWASSGSFCIRI